MMFRAAIAALLASAVSAGFVPSGDVPADSKLGARLLSKAKVVQPARHLEQERDVTFIANYSLRYLGCSSLVQVAEEAQEENMLYTQHLVRFALCPNGSCGSCKNGGEYVVNMQEFVDLYTETKLNQQEYICEQIRENCYCDNANDDEVCENQCYTNQGQEVCIEYEGEGEEFEIQRYLECQEMENQNNNGNNGYYGQYFVGPYCASDSVSINLGVFYDETCTARADDEVWATNNYGQTLPFSTESMVDASDCIDCKQVDEDQNQNQNNNNQQAYYYQQEWEVVELCEQSYEMSARCEEKMEIQYKDTSGCDYINNILPKLESASKSISTGSSSDGKAAKAFAGIFAFTTVLFAAYAYFLYRKIKRGSVDLSSQE